MPDLAGMRRHVAAGNALCAAGPDVETEDVSLGGVRTRVYHGAPGRILVWCHGGGWVTGDLEYSDELCRFLARDAKCTVVSVDYRLAPEHPYPAALDDARAVLASLDGLLAVGGDSAGANLAAVCAGAPMRWAGNAPLHDEEIAYPDSRRVAGVPVTVTDYPSLVHGYFRPADRSSPCADAPLNGSLRKLRSLGADPAARAAVPELTSVVETLFDHAAARAK